jgi:hypothetical protein
MADSTTPTVHYSVLALTIEKRGIGTCCNSLKTNNADPFSSRTLNQLLAREKRRKRLKRASAFLQCTRTSKDIARVKQRERWKFKGEGDHIAPFVTLQGKRVKLPATAGRRTIASLSASKRWS